MNAVSQGSGRAVFRAGIIIALVIAYAGLTVYFRFVQHLDIVHTHFAYFPIVLAGLWWRRRGMIVALALAAFTFSLSLAGVGEGPLWADGLRALFFLVVAACIGLLSEQVSKAQQAAMASEGKYRLLIEGALAGVFVHRDNRIMFLNECFSGMLGYEPGELLGRMAPDLLYEPDRRKCCELISGLDDRSGVGAHHECRFVTRDKKPVWVDLASSMTTYEGAPAVLVNVYNITGRKEAEDKRQELLELSRHQQEQLVHSSRLAELGEMAASIAHEINQPLTGIKNFANNAAYMLETKAGDLGEVQANLVRITEQVDRASRIINQMRTLTRKSDPQLLPVDLNGVIRESVEFMSPQFKLHGIKVDLELNESLPWIRGDKIRLEQVFLNILTNSRQAMAEVEERRISVKSYLDDGINHPAAVVEVTDSGMGFTPEQAEKMFTPFYSTKKIGDGTGLGLSISLTIIKEHGGDIEAIGAPDVGSVFKVMLPVPKEPIDVKA